MNNNFIGTVHAGRAVGEPLRAAHVSRNVGETAAGGAAQHASRAVGEPLRAGLRPAFEPHALRYAVLRGEFNVGCMCVWFGFFCRNYCNIG